jgi:lipopolysaccharide assembly protein A
MRLLKTIVLLLFFGAVILFAFQNSALVKLRFLSWQLQIPLSLASLLLYVFGAISGGIVLSILKKLSFEDSNEK